MRALFETARETASVRATLRRMFLLLSIALSHPGAHAHLEATSAEACDPDIRARRLQALVDEARYDEAWVEVKRGEHCALPSVGATIAQAHLLRLGGRDDEALPLLNSALRLSPGNVAALRQRSALHADAGRLQEAHADALLAARTHSSTALWRWALATAIPPDTALVDEALAATANDPSMVRAGAETLISIAPDRALALLAHLPDQLNTRMLVARAKTAAASPDASLAWEAALQTANAMRPSPRRTELIASIRAEQEALK